jgi:hypothetical protein
MSHDFYTAPSPNTNGDHMRRRLLNVFRILAKPGDERREQALQVRQQVSSAFRNLVQQGTWFAWPTTVAPPSVRKLRGVSWRQDGMLSFLGYHVGKTLPTPEDIRQYILEYAFECNLPPLNDLNYYLEWGEPRTAQRLKKLADTLAALTRNAKRHDPEIYTKAINDWERDLGFLRERYYVGFYFGWPTDGSFH